MIAVRSKSVSASPLMTMKVSSRALSAFLTEPAVPSGVSSTLYSMCIPSEEPSPKWLRMTWGRNATVMITSSMP